MSEPINPNELNKPERVYRWTTVFLIGIACFAVGAVAVKWTDVGLLNACAIALKHYAANCVCPITP